MTDRLDRQIGHVSRDQLRGRVRSGALWSALQLVMRHGFSIGATAILARILSPQDYGLMAMVGTLTALLAVFSDFGLSWATVQRQDLTGWQVNNLFWINTAVGLLLGGATVLLAPAVAQFFGRDELLLVTAVSGIGFVLGGISAQPMALLSRAMRFRVIALIDIASLVTGIIAALVMAYNGWGYWALVGQGMAQSVVRVVLALGLSGLRPAAPRRGAGTRTMVRFGGLLALNGVLIYVTRNLDNVLIGRFWGADALGIYGRAYFLMLLPSTMAAGVLSGLMVPSLSSMQGDLVRLGATYRRAVRMVAWFGMPMAAGLALTAEPAVRLVYGPAWGAVVPLLVWLSIAGITQPIYNTTGWLFTATGRAGRYLWLTAINTVLLGTMFMITVRYSPGALALGYGLMMGLLIPLPALWFAHHSAGIPLRPTLATLAPVFALNLCMAGAVYLAGLAGQALGLGWGAAFTLQVGVGLATYLTGTAILLRDMWRDDLAGLLRS